MTEEEQRIAIAESFGYLQAKHGPDLVPDYLHDLNAMHEAEKQLVMPPHEKPFCVYIDWLVKITKRINPIDATASQRAEAFLRVKGLWKD